MTSPNTSERWLLASLSLAMLVTSFGTSIANVGLPAMGESFDASFQQAMRAAGSHER
jgi:hypothetical protein